MILTVLVSILICVKGDWEIGVATESQVELLSIEGQLLSSAATNMNKTNALAYDPIFGHIYFSDTSHPNVSIFQMEVAKDGRSSDVKPLVKKTDSTIEGIAHDPLSSTLFWTTGISKKIMSAQLVNKDNIEPKILHEFDTEIPKGISVDPCQRQIYWTNCHMSKATIERSHLNGSNRSVIVTDLYLPVSITVSQEDRMIYWVEVDYGHYFSISRSNLDGSKREKVLNAQQQQPISISVSPSNIYWTDFTNTAIWTANKKSLLPKPHEIKIYNKVTPRGIVVLSKFDQLNQKECKNLIELKSMIPSRVSISIDRCIHGFNKKEGGCDCAPGYTGHFCEIPICYNYCLTGSCFITEGKPMCSCTKQYQGKRCEIETCSQDICDNNSTCSIQNGQPTCTCSDGYFGDKCHLSISLCTSYCSESDDKTDPDFKDCSCDSWGLLIRPSLMSTVNNKWQIISWSLMGVLAFFIFIMFGMLYKIYGLSSRPKLIRRYQVTQNKNAKTSDHCEIAIENCCNMNICEIPCYEPEFRTPRVKNKSEDKKTLLNNEIEPDINTDLF